MKIPNRIHTEGFQMIIKYNRGLVDCIFHFEVFNTKLFDIDINHHNNLVT